MAAHPTRERLRGQLLVALYRSGRQADALGAYQQAREVLAEELGIDPSPELQRLHQQILLQDPALEVADPDRALPRHNLPERLTSLIGREGELREVAKLVEEHRLVTVTGPGGSGKTSLAVALAERLAAGYPDGVWLVELAPLREPVLVGEAVAAVLGLEEAGGAGTPHPSRAERLASVVPDKAMLLVLDNCEHLVEACAGLARRLLEAGPRLRVLATSREVLGVPGEVVWPIPPLAFPAPDDESDAGVAGDAGQAAAPEALAGFDAVRLFVERASTAAVAGSSARHSTASAPWAGAGSMSMGSSAWVTSARRPTRASPARATTTASSCPACTLPTRVSRLPRSATTSRPRPSARSWATRRGADVPTVEPAGSSPSTSPSRATRASRESSRVGTAARVMRPSGAVGRSL